jgi:hypothetical protein
MMMPSSCKWRWMLTFAVGDETVDTVCNCRLQGRFSRQRDSEAFAVLIFHQQADRINSAAQHALPHRHGCVVQWHLYPRFHWEGFASTSPLDSGPARLIRKCRSVD